MEFALFLGVIFLAFLVQTGLGFGSAVIAVALGAFLYPIEIIVSSIVPIIQLNVLNISIRHRRYINWHVLLRRILPLMLVGLPAGILISRAGHNHLLKVVFGVFVAVVACLELVAITRTYESRQLTAGKRTLLLLAGGTIHGMFASGGPMAVYVASREISEKHAFRSTLAVLWVVLDGLLLVGFLVDGTYTADRWPTIAVLTIPLLVGSFLGEKLHGRINQVLFRKLVYVLLFVSGVLLIATG